MLASIKDILVISTPEDINDYKSLLEDGSKLGIHINMQFKKSLEDWRKLLLLVKSLLVETVFALS